MKAGLVAAWAAPLCLLQACAGMVIPNSAARVGSVPSAPAATKSSSDAAQSSDKIPRAVPIAPQSAPAGAGQTARQVGVMAGPTIASLAIDEAGARRALTAFIASCPALMKRPDPSGLTQTSDWSAACAAALRVGTASAQAFFADRFDAVQVGAGTAFATAYYEPDLAGSRVRAPGFTVPIYGRPNDLIDVDLSGFSENLKGRKTAGRLVGTKLVPYAERAEIENGALAGRGLEVAWIADPIEAFFLQIQGSGRLNLPDGTMMRVGYAGQNGRDYSSIGAKMRERGLLAPGQATMQGMIAWMRAHPAEGRALLNENKSYVFFREIIGPGPLGTLNVPVVRQASVAADPLFVPLGAPVFLSMDRSDASGLWIAQDTGGAIKGANRFDTFWGSGEEARRIAGGMTARGTAFVFLPKGVLARMVADGRPAS